MQFSLRGTCAKHGGKCTLLLLFLLLAHPGMRTPLPHFVTSSSVCVCLTDVAISISDSLAVAATEAPQLTPWP